MNKPFPIFTQHDVMECGPTCLRMVMAYYGRNYPLERLRDMCHIQRDGVSLLGVAEAAEQLGMHTTGVKATLQQLVDEVPLPCILHWNQGHFVVLYEVKRTKEGLQFKVADPVGQRITYTEREFLRYWASDTEEGQPAGIALMLEPTPDFNCDEYVEDDSDRKARKRSLMLLLSYMRPYKRLIAQLFLGLTVVSLLQLVLPFLTQAIVDFGISRQDLGFIVLVLIAQLMLMIGSTSVQFIQSWILLHVSTRVNLSLLSDYLAKLMRLPFSYFDTRLTGDILQRIDDHDRIQTFLTGSSLSLILSLFNIVVFGAVILIYDWRIFFIFMLGSALYVLWVLLFMRRRAKLDTKLFAQNAANQSKIVQLIDGIQEIKLNTCEQQKRWEWERVQARIFRLNIKSLALNQYQESGATFINEVKNLVITALVAMLVLRGDMTLGMMLSVQYIIGSLNGPVNQLVDFIHRYQDARLSLERLQEVYEKDDEVQPDRQLISQVSGDGDILIKNLTYRYDKLNDKPTLDHIDVVIPHGKTTAIVGLSGSGKTTLLKMILGFYKPDAGEVVIGSSDLENYDKRAWRRHCGVVMQDGFIYSDTIARNIAAGFEVIDTERLVQAARVAEIDDYIRRLPLGYNTKIGAEGSGLSQGQKQRILIARAVYKNPDYVFFDEATNSLDAQNEHAIIQNLAGFLHNRTSLIIAHRLSTVVDADNILVMSEGRIVESGNHTQLLERRGIYYELVKNQLNV